MRIKLINLILVIGILMLLFIPSCKDKEPVEEADPLAGADLPTGTADLIELLKEPYQASINEIMDRLADKGTDAVPALIELLGERGSPQISAIHTLARIGAPAVPDLMIALDSAELQVVYGAARALGEIGTDAEPAVEKLQDVFSSTLKTGQIIIMHVLVKITDKPDVIAMIRAGLMVEDLRFDALRVLEEFGPAAASSVPVILQYLEVQGSPARIQTIRTLHAIGPEEGVVEGIANRLQDTDILVIDAATKALGEFGIAGVAATGAFIEAIETVEPNLQRGMLHTLGLFAPEGRDAIPTLIEYLGSEDPQVRREAAWALGQYGSDASSGLAALRELVESDEFDYVRTTATGAIELIEGIN